MALADTIAAIATAPGKAGVAVVRVSGPEAFAIAERLTGKAINAERFPCCRPLAVYSPTTASVQPQDVDRASSPCQVASEQQQIVLDHSVVLAFKAPRSYTGEDVIEFQCHGGAVTPRRVLDACFAAGARLARRGEFTERALLNGRIDYDQAESILDLINAKTDRAADVALEGIAGRRQRELRAVYDESLSVSSELEHALDVDEEELPENFMSSLAARSAAIAESIRALVERDRASRILRDGALVVLVGEPNVGKSSLLNALLGENRAIVSEVAGTTRDSVEAWLDIEGFPVRLVDTAGLRYGEGVSAIEAEGVRRSETLMKEADIVLSLAEEYVREPAADERTIFVKTKCDIVSNGVGGEGAAETISVGRSAPDRRNAIEVSSFTGVGLSELKAEIARRITLLQPKDDRAGIDLLLSALDSLAAFTPDDPVLAANAMRSASRTLGQLVGAEYSTDLLDRLFSRFCVGK